MNIAKRRACDVLDALELDGELEQLEARPGRAAVYRVVRALDELSQRREVQLRFRARAWSLDLYDAFRTPPKVHRGRRVEPVVLRVVFAKLLEHANKDYQHDAWASQETIVKGCAGIARSTVLEALAVLQELGMQQVRPALGRFPDYERTRRSAPPGAVIRRVIVPKVTAAAGGLPPLQQADSQGLQQADRTPAAGGHKLVPASQELSERGTELAAPTLEAEAADVVRDYAARQFRKSPPDRFVTAISIAAVVALLRDGHRAEHIAEIASKAVGSDPWFQRDDELRTPRRVFGNRERFAAWAERFTPRSRSELHKTAVLETVPEIPPVTMRNQIGDYLRKRAAGGAR